MNFVRSKKLGINFENIVNIRLQDLSIAKHSREIKEEIIEKSRCDQRFRKQLYAFYSKMNTGAGFI